MKPQSQFERDRQRFPLTDCFYHSRMGEWRGWSGPFDGDDDVHRFHKFSREFLLESKRERAKEMAVFGLIVVASAWPVIYMVVTVVKLFLRGQPLD